MDSGEAPPLMGVDEGDGGGRCLCEGEQPPLPEATVVHKAKEEESERQRERALARAAE